MKRLLVAVMVLSVALIVSNCWWLYRAIDVGVTQAYREDQGQHYRVALQQVMAVLPVSASEGATRQDVIQAARSAGSAGDPFEKDGFTWVGELGLQFDEGGRLHGAVVAWQPY